MAGRVIVGAQAGFGARDTRGKEKEKKIVCYYYPWWLLRGPERETMCVANQGVRYHSGCWFV